MSRTDDALIDRMNEERSMTETVVFIKRGTITSGELVYLRDQLSCPVVECDEPESARVAMAIPEGQAPAIMAAAFKALAQSSLVSQEFTKALSKAFNKESGV